jgi:hypothetical protein
MTIYFYIFASVVMLYISNMWLLMLSHNYRKKPELYSF